MRMGAFVFDLIFMHRSALCLLQSGNSAGRASKKQKPDSSDESVKLSRENPGLEVGAGAGVGAEAGTQLLINI